MQLITDTLLGLRRGRAINFHNLTMTPLLAGSSRSLDYLVLDEALASGIARVTEVSAHGSVPDLRFENRARIPVLLLDGEELVGAKQNRVLNLSILAPASTSITIPVSCVEAGRWADRSREFRSEGRAYYAAGRARKAAQVSESLRRSGTRHSRQGEVWDDIAQKSCRVAVYLFARGSVAGRRWRLRSRRMPAASEGGATRTDRIVCPYKPPKSRRSPAARASARADMAAANRPSRCGYIGWRGVPRQSDHCRWGLGSNF